MKWLERLIKWTEDTQVRVQRTILLGRLGRIEKNLQQAFHEMAVLGEENPNRKSNQHFNVRCTLKQAMMDMARYKCELGVGKDVASEFRRIRSGAI